jgi:hypothetical protein
MCKNGGCLLLTVIMPWSSDPSMRKPKSQPTAGLRVATPLMGGHTSAAATRISDFIQYQVDYLLVNVSGGLSVTESRQRGASRRRH